MIVAPNHAPPAATVDPKDPATLRLSGRWTLRYANEIGDALRAAPEVSEDDRPLTPDNPPASGTAPPPARSLARGPGGC